jgi:PST family polysaccharide transporter
MNNAKHKDEKQYRQMNFIINGYEKIVKRHKTILSNFSYLSILQLSTVFFPLITYPYLLRVIGTESYGVVIFAQTIIVYISLIINLGFNLSATRYVAINKEDKQKLSEIVSSVYISKSVIWLICLIIYNIIIISIPFFEKHFWVYFLSFFMTFNELLFPVWFFQGTEKMRYITIINISVRSLFTILIFFIIKSHSDYLYIPLLNSLSFLFGGVFSIYIILKKENVRLFILPFRNIKIHFKESITLFISIASVQVYLHFNKVVIGTFLGMSEITIYDLGEKVLSLLKLPINIINQAVFPKISREKNIKFINKMMFLAAIITTIGYIVIFIYSKLIVLFFFDTYIENAIHIIHIMNISAIVVAFNSFMGGGRLVPMGYNKVYMRVMLLNCLFFLCSNGLLWLFDLINLYTLSIMVICVEGFCFFALIYYNNKFHLMR